MIPMLGDSKDEARELNVNVHSYVNDSSRILPTDDWLCRVTVSVTPNIERTRWLSYGSSLMVLASYDVPRTKKSCLLGSPGAYTWGYTRAVWVLLTRKHSHSCLFMS